MSKVLGIIGVIVCIGIIIFIIVMAIRSSNKEEKKDKERIKKLRKKFKLGSDWKIRCTSHWDSSYGNTDKWDDVTYSYYAKNYKQRKERYFEYIKTRERKVIIKESKGCEGDDC